MRRRKLEQNIYKYKLGNIKNFFNNHITFNYLQRLPPRYFSMPHYFLCVERVWGALRGRRDGAIFSQSAPLNEKVINTGL